MQEPALLNRIHCMLNSFHAYTHELKCQIEYRPKNTFGAGESDGEEPERMWHKLSLLVSAGQVSSPPQR